MSKSDHVILPDEHSTLAKIAAVRSAVQFSFPTADIERMNREIEKGYRTPNSVDSRKR